MKLKRKQRQKLAIAGVVGGIVLAVIGFAIKATLPPELPMSDPGWFDQARDRSNREMLGWILIGGGGFMLVVSVQELLRIAKKLKL